MNMKKILSIGILLIIIGAVVVIVTGGRADATQPMTKTDVKCVNSECTKIKVRECYGNPHLGEGPWDCEYWRVYKFIKEKR